jgi:hypothetical protein
MCTYFKGGYQVRDISSTVTKAFLSVPINISLCKYMNICIYVYMYVFMYVCMYVYMHICKYVHIYVS